MLKALDRGQVLEAIDLADKLNEARRDLDRKWGIVPGKGTSLGEVKGEWLTESSKLTMNSGLRSFLSALSKDQLAELMALMWFGREHGEGSWPSFVAQARENVNGVGTIDYIMDKSPLAQYLRDGLRALGN